MKKKTITGKINNFCIESCENNEAYLSNAPVRIAKKMPTYCYGVNSDYVNFDVLQIKHFVDPQFGIAKLNLKIVKEGKLPKIRSDYRFNSWETRSVEKFALLSKDGTFTITLGDNKVVINNKDEKRHIRINQESFYKKINGTVENIKEDIEAYHVADIIVSNDNISDATILLEVNIICTSNDMLNGVLKMLEEF